MKQEIGRNRSGLRLGYTTGSCAAAAAKAAVAMLLKEEEITHVKLITPKGIELYLEVESTIRTADYVQCAVEKYSGDDPDVTDGMKVYAKAEKIESFLKEEEAEERCFEIKDHIVLAGGEGIGRVTKAGLEQQTGFPAINKIPRRMIADAMVAHRRRTHAMPLPPIWPTVPYGHVLFGALTPAMMAPEPPIRDDPSMMMVLASCSAATP